MAYGHDGVQLQKKVYTKNNISLTNDYVDGIKYANNNISAIYFEDGRAYDIQTFL